MAIIVGNITAPLDMPTEEVIALAIKRCGLSEGDVRCADIHKTSLDARRRGGSGIHFVHSVYIETRDPAFGRKIAAKVKDCRYSEPAVIMPGFGSKKPQGRIVIAGFGPAGMFAALLLAQYGYRPLVLEKGASVEERTALVEHFWKTGELDENSNVQFGEGGAGTFSDGKLTTRIKDPRCRFVLETFAKYGADRSVLTKSKPHIGTDMLRSVVRNIRREIIAMGGEIAFCTPLTGLNIKDGRVTSVVSSRGEEPCAALIAACGHSAGETFRLFHGVGIELMPKAFSVGVRIEHKQSAVDSALYGELAGSPLLPKGEYQLSHHTADGRGVYTFCMCPGGTVVAAASESGQVVTNGMSEFARAGENANAAIAVSVTPDDFEGLFGGTELQKKIERAAYDFSHDYIAPATTVGGFLDGSPTLKNASVTPSYQRGVEACELRTLFPDFVSSALEEGLRAFPRKLSCYGDEGAVLTAPETRTSSPIRIPRGESLTAGAAENFYPCGEGAGYAGGITSAAVDGIRAALAVMERYAHE